MDVSINNVTGFGFVNTVSKLTDAGTNSSMLSGNSYATYMKDCKLVLMTK